MFRWWREDCDAKACDRNKGKTIDHYRQSIKSFPLTRGLHNDWGSVHELRHRLEPRNFETFFAHCLRRCFVTATAQIPPCLSPFLPSCQFSLLPLQTLHTILARGFGVGVKLAQTEKLFSATPHISRVLQKLRFRRRLRLRHQSPSRPSKPSSPSHAFLITPSSTQTQTHPQ